MKRLSLTFLIFVIFVSAVMADSDDGGQAGATLRRGMSARAQAMGGCMTGFAGGVTALYYNPANVDLIDKGETFSQYSSLKFDQNYSVFGFAMPLSTGAIGIYYLKYSVDDIIGRSDANTITGFFDDKEQVFALGYGDQLNKNLRAGLVAKYFKHDLYNQSANTLAFDIGVSYILNPKVTFGLAMKELGGSLKWDSGRKESIPATIIAGIAARPRKNLLFALDIGKTENMDAYFNVGGEIVFKDKISLRAGYNKVGDDDGDFTFGAGMKFKQFFIDYSYTDSTLGDMHLISSTWYMDSIKRKVDKFTRK